MALTLGQRIEAFVKLGERMETFPADQFLELAIAARNKNSWFTFENVRLAWNSIRNYLLREPLETWLEKANLSEGSQKKVGVVMAGNIPMVGFHDFLCVLISGHHLYAKLSSDDPILLPLLSKWIGEISPELASNIHFVDRLNHMDAVIATGSNNTARYFEFYFKDIPHIIRKNRSSLAILNGSETADDIYNLGLDIFTYFGLGCRNVSKVYVPQGFDMIPFIDGLEPHSAVIQHHKYNNNYDYTKSIYLVNGENFLDNGFLLLKEHQPISSPVAVLYYETYSDTGALALDLKAKAEQIQCIVSQNSFWPGSVQLGKSQAPNLWDYADGMDVLAFLSSIK